jgi:hypothetical protein
MELQFYRRIFEKVIIKFHEAKYQISWKSVQWETSCYIWTDSREGGRTDGLTEWRTDMTKLIILFRNFAKEPKTYGRSETTSSMLTYTMPYVTWTRLRAGWPTNCLSRLPVRDRFLLRTSGQPLGPIQTPIQYMPAELSRWESGRGKNRPRSSRLASRLTL